MLLMLFPDEIQMHGEQMYSYSTYETAKIERSALQSLKKHYILLYIKTNRAKHNEKCM